MEEIYVETFYECEHCQKQFNNADVLQNHLQFHETEKAKKKGFECDVCHKVFASNGALKNHLKTHAAEKSFICTTCNKSFNTSHSLNLHMSLHTKTKIYACDVCKKAFPDKQKLKTHARFHGDEKTYICDYCKKMFSGRSTFKKHLKVHDGEKRFSCDNCKMSFKTKVDCKRHLSKNNCKTSLEYNQKLINDTGTSNQHFEPDVKQPIEIKKKSVENPSECDCCHKTLARNSPYTLSSGVSLGWRTWLLPETITWNEDPNTLQMLGSTCPDI